MKVTFASLRRRPRSTPEERAKWVRRYEQSGLSQRDFAERHGLGVFTLRRWIAQAARDASPTRNGKPVWQELTLGGLAGANRWAAEVVWPDGLVVRVAYDTPMALLQELLRVFPC